MRKTHYLHWRLGQYMYTYILLDASQITLIHSAKHYVDQSSSSVKPLSLTDDGSYSDAKTCI